MHEDALPYAKDIIAEYWSTIVLQIVKILKISILTLKDLNTTILLKKHLKHLKLFASLKIGSINISGVLDSK